MRQRYTCTRRLLVLAAEAACLVFTVNAGAQVKTETTTAIGNPTKVVEVQNAEVVYVSGNDLVLQMQDGTIRHLSNVPESARATVDGKEIGIHDVKVGMKLQRTITTTTVPKVVTTVQSVTGTVWHIQPPSMVILTLDDGTNQKFNIPKGQKFNVNGQMVDAWGLKKGMKVSATKVVEAPVTEVEQQRLVTGSMPPPPPAPPADVPVLVAIAVPVEMPTAAAPPATASLPKTGSDLPLVGLVGIISLLSAIVLKMRRKIA